MASMSYCRFENTLGDLAECVEAMENAATLQDLTAEMSTYELHAFQMMWRVCRDFLAEHERLLSTSTAQEREECV